MMRTTGFSRAVRATAVVLVSALLSACAGSRTIPEQALGGFTNAASNAAVSAARRGHKIPVRIRVRIPRRAHQRALHPATISPLTQSVGISVNAGNQSLFNTTTSSPGCVAGANGIVCTFSVDAAIGTDAFAVTTYSATKGGGTPLDHGIATVPIAKGKANAVAISLGPVVSITADNGMGSLRYAIASASQGDTIMFLLPANSTIVVATALPILSNVTVAGPGANVLTISGASAQQIFSVAGTLTLTGLTLAHGNATSTTGGGAIFNEGTLVLANDVIESNQSSSSSRHSRTDRKPRGRLHPHCTSTFYAGGAIENDSAVISSGNTYTGNDVPSDPASCLYGEGGAVYNAIGATFISTGDTFTRNSAYEGGAVFNKNLTETTFTNDTFDGNTGCNASNGCPTMGCTTGGCTSNAVGQGGAIFDAGGSTIASSTFENNVVGGPSNGSNGSGGAIYFSGGSPMVTGSTFSGNEAGGGSASCSAGTGGAIISTVALQLDGDTFTNNQAGGDDGGQGGAVDSNEPVTGSNDAFSGNTAFGSGSACTPNANAGGGAVFSGGQASFSASSFSRNFAEGSEQAQGGAIVANPTELNGDTFTGNAAVGTGNAGATGVSASGGAVFTTAGTFSGDTFTSNGAAIEGANSSQAIGGAVYAAASLLTSASSFTSNTVTESVGSGTVWGGAIAAQGGSLISTGDSFESNAATGSNDALAGALLLGDGFELSRDVIASNSANGETAYGGGIDAKVVGTISDCVISSNAANASSGPGQGGGVWDAGGTEFFNSTLSKNVATTAGGAIFADGDGSVSGSTIAGNSVTKAALPNNGGGGIFVNASETVSETAISGNSVTVSGASSGGGGIYATGSDDLIVEQSAITQNSVKGGGSASGGGGIYSDIKSFSLTDSTLEGNGSQGAGGGLLVAGSSLQILTGDTLYRNAADGAGGNLENLSSMQLANSIVAGGSASSGPDIENAGTLTSEDYNLIETTVGGTALAGTTLHDLTGDPKLLSLSKNGGPTETDADQAGSPGVAYIPYAALMCGNEPDAVDQRDYERGTNGKCDIGAYELNATVQSTRHRLATHLPHRAHASHGLVPRPVSLPAPIPLDRFE